MGLILAMAPLIPRVPGGTYPSPLHAEGLTPGTRVGPYLGTGSLQMQQAKTRSRWSRVGPVP